MSYRTKLGKSLKQISLSKTPLSEILLDVAEYRTQFQEISVGDGFPSSRFKSIDSVERKYGKTVKSGGGFKQCFNDLVGLRMHFEEYPTEFSEYFRVVDLRSGKKYDDGYHAIHLYYQLDSFHYPIEVQLWCGNDYRFNVWSHDVLYKHFPGSVGKQLREDYDAGLIDSEAVFNNRIQELQMLQKLSIF